MESVITSVPNYLRNLYSKIARAKNSPVSKIIIYFVADLFDPLGIINPIVVYNIFFCSSCGFTRVTGMFNCRQKV
jgi:hypothetical protein